MKRFILVLALFASLLSPKSSEACSCVDAATEEQRAAMFQRQYDDAVAVFVGRAVETDRSGNTFIVQQVWKGDLRERVHLQRSSGSPSPDLVVVSSCEYFFAPTQTYLVFAYGTASAMWAQKCTPTTELSDAAEALERLKSIAPPRPPNPEREPEP